VSEVTSIIDAEDFGDIREVSIKYDSHGEQFAVVHFNRWFRGADETAELLYGGGEIKIKAMYGKYFVLRMFRMPVRPVSISIPRPKHKDAALKPKDAAPKPKDVAPKPKDAAPKPKDAALKPKDAALKPKDAAPKPKPKTQTPLPKHLPESVHRPAPKHHQPIYEWHAEPVPYLAVPKFLPPQPQQYVGASTYYPTNTLAMPPKVEQRDVDMVDDLRQEKEEGEL